jgi:hypothetical protein
MLIEDLETAVQRLRPTYQVEACRTPEAALPFRDEALRGAEDLVEFQG